MLGWTYLPRLVAVLCDCSGVRDAIFTTFFLGEEVTRLGGWWGSGGGACLGEVGFCAVPWSWIDV